MSRKLALVSAAVVVVTATAAAVAAQQKPIEPPPGTQPFRSGAHYVRVDAYPTRDGKPLLGLTADDFEVLEDGKPQTIDRLEFIEHPAWTPLGERRDPNSQRDAFELARNPGYRVFVLYFNPYHIGTGGAHRLEVPVRDLLARMLGPKDLFGALTPAQTPKELILGQLTQSIEDQLKQPFWEMWSSARQTPEELELWAAFPRDRNNLVALRRLDKVYTDLEQLIDLLGALREERKNVVYFADTLPSPPSEFRTMASDPSRGGRPPAIGVGVNDKGTLTLGSRNSSDPDRLRMGAERDRLLAIDFDTRFRDILRRAREANVSFYTVRPGGLDEGSSMMLTGTSNLKVLAEQTDGVAVLASNDLRNGMTRIADDLSSHYVLGYYTSNTKWDGRTRTITVRLKATRQNVRARHEYRAPTAAEMAALTASRGAAAAPAAPSAGDTALGALARLRPAARVQAYGVARDDRIAVVAEIAATEIEEGRWKQGAQVEVSLTSKDGAPTTASGRIEPGARGTVIEIPVGAQAGPWQIAAKVRGDDPIPESDTVAVERGSGTLLGRPLAYRAGSAAASPFRPIAIFHFRRTERVRFDWPALRPLQSHSARLLDRTGKPLPVPVTLTAGDAGGTPTVSGTLNLAPLSIGDYLVEITAAAGDVTEQQIVAIRVAMAR